MNDMKRIVLATAVMVIVAAGLFATCSEEMDGANYGGLPSDRTDITYNVTFNGNGGTSSHGDKATFEIKGGTNSIELPVTTWTYQGKYLTGWYSLVQDKTFALGEKYTPKSNDLLTAQWADTLDGTTGSHWESLDKTISVGKGYTQDFTITGTTGPDQSQLDKYSNMPSWVKITFNGRNGSWLAYDRENYYTITVSSAMTPGHHVIRFPANTDRTSYGWFVITVGSSFDITSTITYYTGEIGESGTQKIGSITAPNGTAITLRSDAGTKSGYTLTSWNINDGYGNLADYALGSSYTVHGNYNAIAQWYGDAHVAVFIIDGGSLNVKGYVTHTGESFQLLGESDVVEKSGKDFIGWQRVVDGKATEALYAPSLNMTSSEDMIFAAYYIDSGSTTYTVTFDANGGTGGFQQRVKPGMSVYLPTEAQVSLTANNFDGWNVKGNENILTGTTYTPSKSITLMANWTPQEVPPTDIYISGSSSVRIGEKLYLYARTTGASDAVRGAEFEITSGGEYAKITEQKQTNTGGYCYIEGLKEGGTVTVRAYSIIDSDVDCTKTVTVKGELKNYAITYNANGGINAPTATETSSDYDSVNLYITSERPSKAGWTFDGWNTSSDGKGTKYTAGQMVTLTSPSNMSLALYAQWTENPHTYYLEYNLGTNADGEKAPGEITTQAEGSKETSVKMNVTLEKPGWVGYKFLGWSETAVTAGKGNSSDVKYSPGDEITISRTSDTSQTSTTKILYAVWADNYNEYKLELDPNEGKFSDGSSESKVYTIKLVATSYSYQIPADSDPTKDGAEFVGWSTSGSAVLEEGDKIYYAGDYVPLVAKDNAASITLMAIWSDGQGSHKIIFEDNAGTDAVTGMPTSASATSVNGMSTLKIPDSRPVRETSGDSFYIFAGWKEKTSGKTYYSGTVQSAVDLTFQAVWMPFKLTLDGNYATLTNGGAAVGVEVYIDWLGDGNTSGNLSGTQKTATYSYSEKGTYEVGITVAMSGGKGFESSVTRTLTVKSEPTSFTVTYHSNNGKNETENQYGLKVKIKDCIFEGPDGLKFDSWNTAADGSGTKYSAGSTQTLTANLDLYAQWSESGSNDDDEEDEGMPVWAIAVATIVILIAGFVIITRVI